MPGLDVAVAADLFRDGGERHGEMVVVGGEPGEDVRQQPLIVADQLTLAAAFGGAAERGRALLLTLLRAVGLEPTLPWRTGI